MYGYLTLANMESVELGKKTFELEPREGKLTNVIRISEKFGKRGKTSILSVSGAKCVNEQLSQAVDGVEKKGEKSFALQKPMCVGISMMRKSNQVGLYMELKIQKVSRLF